MISTNKPGLFASIVIIILIGCQSQNNYSSDTEVIAKGKLLFETQCSACHNFQRSGIGPALGGITLETSASWLREFVKNPAAMIETGDERAVELHDKYPTIMPSFDHMSEEEFDAILAFMNTFEERPELKISENIGPPLEDPIPDTVPMTDMVLQLRQIAVAPATSEKRPKARINKMIPMPGASERLFISDLNGLLYELKNGQLIPFLTIAENFDHFINTPGLATGLGSFAFHPDYQKNGLFYTNHTEDPESSAPADFTFADSIPPTVRWVLTEWKMSDPGASTFSGTKRELMRVDMITGVHGMQEITFNPLAKPGNEDYGLLFIGIGDGGSVGKGHPFIVQEKGRIWGKILRIDPSGDNSANGHYGVPPSNPFASESHRIGNSVSNALGETYAMGFRNPHRMLWDKMDGKMLATNIGHQQIEELELILKGHDYGWPEREGTFLFDKSGDLAQVYNLPENDAAFGFTYPVLEFDHDVAGAISSGYIYYGEMIPALHGKLIFGGITNGRVFYTDSDDLQLGRRAPFHEVRLRLENGPVTTLRDLIGGHNRTDLRFGYDQEGELYIMTKSDGKIYKIVGVDDGGEL